MNLSEQLIDQPSVIAQHDLIVAAAARLFLGRAEMCLSEAVYRLPGIDHLPPEYTGQPTSLMQAAVEARQLVISPGEAEPVSPARTCMAGPLVCQDVLLGVLQVERAGRLPFSDPEIDFFKKFTSHLAAVLQLTHQISVKSWRLEQLSLVRSVSAQIANVQELDELARQVTRLILNTFHYYYVGIYTVEPGMELLHFRASALAAFPAGEAADRPRFDVHIGEGLIGAVAQSGQEILAAAVQDEPRYRFIDILPETRSEFALPLKIENRVLGVLDIQSSTANGFHEIDQLVLRALADNIAIAIEGARLYTSLQMRADQLSTIAEVSRAITSILDVDSILNEVVTLLHERFGYPFVHVFTVHQGRRKVIYQAGSGPRSQALQAQGLAFELDDPHGMIPWVARTGKALVANDVDQEPHYRPSELPPHDTRAELVIPFVYAGEVLGLLDVQSNRKNVFNEDDLFLFEALADNIAVAIRNARLYRSEKWRRQVAESLRDVAGLLTANVALDKVLDSILTELERTLPCSVAAIWLLGDDIPELDRADGQDLRLAAVHGGNKTDIENIRGLFPDGDAMLTRALNSDQPVIRTAADPVGPLGSALDYPQDYSSIAAPLRAGGQALGVLALAHPTSDRYGEEAQRMTAAFASYAAVAIENTRLYHSAQEQAWVSTVMLQVAEATQALTTVEELSDAVVRLTPMLVGVKGCALFLWDTSQEAFHLASVYGIEPEQQAEFEREPIHPGEALAFDRVRFGKAPVFIEDCQNDLRFPGETCGPSRYDFVLLPLLARGEVLGAILVEHRDTSPHPEGSQAFGSDRMAILNGLAQQTAIAIENIRLLEGKQEEAYVTAVLLQVAQAVVSLNELGDILESIVEVMPILVGIDFCVIYLWDSARKVFYSAHLHEGSWPVQADQLSRDFSPGEFPILDLVRETDGLVICPMAGAPEAPGQWCGMPLPQDSPDYRLVLREKGNLLMGFPLSVKGAMYGVLLALESGRAPEFRERRVEILTGIAQQAALAIQNDYLNREMVERERLEREFQLAREIQRTFLPNRLPVVPGWELDVRWRPALEVGGDFYDAFHLPGDRLGLVIADVSDKGMPAALYMTVARTLIRATAQKGDPPARVLSRVNDLLLMDSQNSMFITCVYAVVSLKSGQVIYANAGHNIPLLLRSSSGKLESLAKGRAALAVFGKIHYEDSFVTLAPEDSLILFTDGITEAFSPKEELFGDQRLAEAIQGAQDSSAHEILESIDRALTEFTANAPASDDITMIAFRRRF